MAAHSSKKAAHPILGLQGTIGNQAVQRLLRSRVTVRPPGDVYEQEADRIADRVTRASPDVEAGALVRTKRVAPNNSGEAIAPGIVNDVLRSPGEPLDPTVRAFMEPRFGRNFSDVRVHSDSPARQSADAIGAQAYTAGTHVVFAGGGYAPETPSGKKLIAHELAHVEQQAGSGATIQRQPVTGQNQPASPNAQPKIKRKWKEIWEDFDFAKHVDRARVPALVEELLEAADSSEYDFDFLETGMKFVEWLESNGDTVHADRVLQRVRLAFITDNDLPSGGLFLMSLPVDGNPATLIKLGEDAARAGQHERAFQFLGVAHAILSDYALQITKKAGATLSDRTRRSPYTALQGIYGEMREIYGFYYVLEREALVAGDAKAAADARAKAAELRTEIQWSYTIAHAPAEKTGGEDSKSEKSEDRFRYGVADTPAEVAETSVTKTSTGGPAVTYHGANVEETDLTELPGHEFPQDVLKTREGQVLENLDILQSTIMQQAEVQAEIEREPEVRKAFNGREIDLNNTATRQSVWQIMYGVYKTQGSNPLEPLMALIGRYLKAFTVHTGFNVRDFGESYLKSPMPTDLAGRLVRDCGVYALTVAWDVFKTAKAAKLDLTFTLATFLDHVTLIVTDESTGEYYLVNNNQITPIPQPRPIPSDFPRPKGLKPNVDVYREDPVMIPEAANLEEEVARQYASLRKLDYVATPVNYIKLGSTKESAGAFESEAWSKFLKVTEYAAKPPIAFAIQEAFSKNSKLLDLGVDQLTLHANDRDAIAQWLDDRWEFILAVMGLFEHLNNAFLGLPPPAGSYNEISSEYRKGGSLPLVRIALVLLRLEALKGTLSPSQQRYLGDCKRIFKTQMDKLSEQGKAGQF